jgi:hypothetical protein
MHRAAERIEPTRDRHELRIEQHERGVRGQRIADCAFAPRLPAQ